MVHFRFPIRQLPAALQDFASEMETIVDQVFNQSECKTDRTGERCEVPVDAKAFTPAIDIYESEAQFDLYVDLPGVKADAIKLEMQEEKLVVSGTRGAVAQGAGVSPHRVERVVGNFSRAIRLPKQTDVERISADFDNGVLHVALPKQLKQRPRTIEIKTN